MISVIIPTCNRASTLLRVLHAIGEQSFPSVKFEVLVIDNGSTDETPHVVEEAKSYLPNIRYFYAPSPGLHVGRHQGCQAAAGDILVYIDDDVEPFPTWLATIEECFEQEDVALVGGKDLPNYEVAPPGWILEMWKPVGDSRIIGYLSLLDLGDKPTFISPFHVFGCNFAIRKSVLIEARGFHPDSLPPELIRFRGDGETPVSEYIHTHGYKTFYHPEASVHHLVPKNRMTVAYFCQRSFNQGISDSFTQIRRANQSTQAGIAGKDTGKGKQLFAEMPTRLKGKALNFIRRISQRFASTNRMSDELASIKAQLAAAYDDGYAFHQEEVRKDPELLRWVLQSDYWDGRVPTSQPRKTEPKGSLP